MFRRCVLLCLLCIAFPLGNASAWADIDAQAVNKAIQRGINYLRTSQLERGGWEEYPGHSCGLTSLCTLALLNAGLSRDDPTITQAMKYLRATVADDTYSVSLQTLAFCHLGSASDLPRIRNNVKWLSEAQTATGLWGYGARRQSSGDPSNAQFALLALGAAQDRGVQVQPALFSRAIEYWKRKQYKNGGWSYSGNLPTGSMTCAGVCSLIIANGRLGNASSSVKNGRIQCCGGDEGGEDPIAKGIQWLAERFSVDVNPGGNAATYFYYLYALERTGRLSGRRFIGGHDWYREGAERLIAQQDGFQGFWSNGKWERPTVATSFALLFLSKGKRQVVVGQLDRGDEQASEWQPHPDGLRQLVRHVERAWGRDLTWQTVRLADASVVDLLQCPALVISGRETLSLTADQNQRLKDYVDQGGTILFDASGDLGCGSAEAFQQSVTELCGQWYPDAPLERLPTSHPVWSAERKVDISALPDGFWVYGVQACCRTAIFFVPQSLTCRWELGERLFRRGDNEDPVRREIDHSVRIGQNILAYATGRELKDKLDDRIVLQAATGDRSERGTTRIARLDVGAGGAEARRALPNVTTIIRNQTQVAVTTTSQAVPFEADALADVSLLWVHGRTDFELNAEQRTMLTEFIKNGGVVFGTAICGDESFADAFRREMATVAGGNPLKPMPADHPMLSPQYYGYDLRSVTIRKIVQGSGGQQIRKQQSPPVLEFAESDETVAVVFSPLDVSCALESQNSVQCPGYSTEDAAKIVTNLVQMTLNQ